MAGVKTSSPSFEANILTDELGLVREVGTTSSGNQKLFIRLQDPKTGYIDLYAIYTEGEHFEVGDMVALTGEVIPFEARRVPGEYDEKLYMQTKGIEYKIYPDEVRKMGETRSFPFRKLKECVFDIFDTVLPQKESGIVKAMVTGEKDDIQQETWDLYRKAGINHILCVSGLHVSLFALFLHFLLKRCFKQPKRVVALGTMVCCISFLVFTGFSPSSVRAVTMIVISLFGVIIYRKSEWINSLALAAIVILLIQPLYLWNAGFQLSFVTAFGIWMGLQVLDRGHSKAGKLKQSAVLSIYASLFSYPLVAYHFFSISLIGVVLNMLILPLSGILLFFSFLTAVFGLLVPPLAGISAGGVYGILKFFEMVCSVGVSIPNSYFLVGAPSILSIVLCYVLFIMCSFYGKRFCHFKGLCCVFVVLMFSMYSNRLFFHQNTVTFLDVGQGDAAVVSTYDGRAIVIDGGGWHYREIGENTGVQVVQPYLEYLGIRELDGIFLTHFDNDHMLGVIELCENVPTKGLYISGYPYADLEKWEVLKEILEKKDIMLYTVKQDEKSDWGSGGSLECLYPPEGVKFIGGDDNHGSLVLKYEYDGTKVLFTGDAASEDERIMLNTETDLSADILKLGHHGSKYSSSEAFLEEVSPSIAMISCGEDNIYSHPHSETLERMEEDDISVYRTDKQGTILAKLSPKGGYTVEAVLERKSVYERIKETVEK
ncbi:MAG: DNA internalization-related competence protein ComEC/Rec2 [Anaerotignum sp.]